MLNVLFPKHWEEYELLDSGHFGKLERFGSVVTRRPEPQAVWEPRLSENEWVKLADVTFKATSSSAGTWHKKNAKLPDRWNISYKNPEGLALQFRLALTAFKHVGIFPEQAAHWDFIFAQTKKLQKPRVLNIFAYTGGATLAACAGGAAVTHVDSVKQVVTWANENLLASKLPETCRWMIDDALKFVEKEVRRENTYHGIILDPPAYGHGVNGEKWKLEEHILPLVKNLGKLLTKEGGFLVFNAYSMGFSALVLENLVRANFPTNAFKTYEIGELVLKERSGKVLPTGVYVRAGG